MAIAPIGGPPGTAGGSSGYPQWGIKLASGNKSGTIIEAQNAAQKLSYEKQGYLEWFTSDSAAKNQLSSETSALNGSIPGLPSFSLDIKGIAAWFERGLKVVLGSILMIMAVSHLTGSSNKITEIVGKVAPIAAVA